MSRNHLVRLPGHDHPTFPERCVGCAHDRPEGTAAMVAREFHLSHLVLLFCFGARTRLEVPMCTPCEDAYRTSRRWRLLVCIAGGIGVICGALFLLPQLPGVWRTVALPLVLLGGLAPPILWKALAPFPIDPVRTREGLCLDFREAEIAEEFAGLNDAEVTRR